MANTEVVIVGGGISGLSTAYFLSRFGIRSTLIEKSNRLGGLIRTDFVEGCWLEAGPDSYLASKPEVTQLAQEVERLRGQVIGSNDKLRRVFVVRHGRLLPLPKGMVMMVPVQVKPALQSELFSFGTKLRFIREMFSMPREGTGDVCVEKFVLSHFGKEILDYVAEPLLTGVYGGEPENLSAESVLPQLLAYERRHGSLIRGLRRARAQNRQDASVFSSFRGGMQVLPDSLAHATAGWTEIVHQEVTSVERDADRWVVKMGSNRVLAKNVVLASPAYVSSQLLESSILSLASALAEIPYLSAILVTLVYERSQLRHPFEGFGFLVPRIERRSVAAATWISSKFPSRVRSDLAAIRAFIVGEDAARLMGAPDQELIEIVRSELRRLMEIELAPLFQLVHRWPRSMPQYVVGHPDRRRKIAEATDACPGLYVVGSAYSGVGIPDCIRLAKETAKSISSAVSQ